MGGSSVRGLSSLFFLLPSLTADQSSMTLKGSAIGRNCTGNFFLNKNWSQHSWPTEIELPSSKSKSLGGIFWTNDIARFWAGTSDHLRTPPNTSDHRSYFAGFLEHGICPCWFGWVCVGLRTMVIFFFKNWWRGICCLPLWPKATNFLSKTIQWHFQNSFVVYIQTTSDQV